MQHIVIRQHQEKTTRENQHIEFSDFSLIDRIEKTSDCVEFEMAKMKFVVDVDGTLTVQPVSADIASKKKSVETINITTFQTVVLRNLDYSHQLTIQSPRTIVEGKVCNVGFLSITGSFELSAKTKLSTTNLNISSVLEKQETLEENDEQVVIRGTIETTNLHCECFSFGNWGKILVREHAEFTIFGDAENKGVIETGSCSFRGTSNWNNESGASLVGRKLICEIPTIVNAGCVSSEFLIFNARMLTNAGKITVGKSFTGKMEQLINVGVFTSVTSVDFTVNLTIDKLTNRGLLQLGEHTQVPEGKKEERETTEKKETTETNKICIGTGTNSDVAIFSVTGTPQLQIAGQFDNHGKMTVQNFTCDSNLVNIGMLTFLHTTKIIKVKNLQNFGGGQLQCVDHVQMECFTWSNQEEGTITGENFSLVVTDKFVNEGEMKMRQNLQLISTQLENTGQLHCGGELVIESRQFTNSDLGTLHTEKLCRFLVGSFHNYGQFSTSGELIITGDSLLNSGTLAFGNKEQKSPSKITVQKNLTNRGKISIGGACTLSAENFVNNSIINTTSTDQLTITVTGISPLISNGEIRLLGDLTLTGALITLAGTVIVGGNLFITCYATTLKVAGKLQVDKQFQGYSNLTIASGASVHISSDFSVSSLELAKGATLSVGGKGKFGSLNNEGIINFHTAEFPINFKNCGELTVREGTIRFFLVENQGKMNFLKCRVEMWYLSQTKYGQTFIHELIPTNHTWLFQGGKLFVELLSPPIATYTHEKFNPLKEATATFRNIDATILDGKISCKQLSAEQGKLTLCRGHYLCKELTIDTESTLHFSRKSSKTAKNSCTVETWKLQNYGTIESEENLQLLVLHNTIPTFHFPFDKYFWSSSTISSTLPTQPTISILEPNVKDLPNQIAGNITVVNDFTLVLANFVDAFGVLTRLEPLWKCGGKLKLRCDRLQFTQSVKNTCHLDVEAAEVVIGNYEWSCLSLNITTKKFSIGAGSLFALNGPLHLRVTGEEQKEAKKGGKKTTKEIIDLSRAKIYGHGVVTLILPTNAKLVIGDKVSLSPTFKGEGSFDPVTKTRFKYTRNDSYIKSGKTGNWADGITINAHDVEVKYGTVYSAGKLVWNVTNNLTILAGFVTAENYIDVNAAKLELKRDVIFHEPTYWTPCYTGCYNQRFSSDSAVLQSFTSIYFNTKEATITASVVKAGNGIYFDGSTSNTTKPASFKVNSTTLGNYGHHDRGGLHRGCYSWVCPSVLMSGQTIDIGGGDKEIKMSVSGSLSAPTISITVANLDVTNFGGAPTSTISSTIVIDLGKYGSKFLEQPSMFKLLDAPTVVEKKCLIDFNVPASSTTTVLTRPSFADFTKIPLWMSPRVLKFALFEGLAQHLGKLNIGDLSGDQLFNKLQQEAHFLGTEEKMENSNSTQLVYRPQQMEALGQFAYVAHLITSTGTNFLADSTTGTLCAEKDIKIKTTGDATFRSSTLYAGKDIDIKVGGKLTRDTLLHTFHSEDVTETKAIARERMIAGDQLRVVGKQAYSEVGSITCAQGDVIKGSTEGPVEIRPVIETRVEKEHSSSGGGLFGALFGGEESATVRVMHNILPATSTAGRDHTILAGENQSVELKSHQITAGRDTIISAPGKSCLKASGTVVIDTVDRVASTSSGLVGSVMGGRTSVDSTTQAHQEVAKFVKGTIETGRDFVLDVHSAEFTGVDVKWGRGLEDKTENLSIGPLEFDTTSYSTSSVSSNTPCMLGGQSTECSTKLEEHHVVPSSWQGESATFGSRSESKSPQGTLTLISTRLDVQTAELNKRVLQKTTKSWKKQTQTFHQSGWSLFSLPTLQPPQFSEQVAGNDKLLQTVRDVTSVGQFASNVYKFGSLVVNFCNNTTGTSTWTTARGMGELFGTMTWTNTKQTSNLFCTADVPNFISWGDLHLSKPVNVHLKGFNTVRSLRGEFANLSSEPLEEIFLYDAEYAAVSTSVNPFTLSFSHGEQNVLQHVKQHKFTSSLLHFEESTNLTTSGALSADGLRITAEQNLFIKVGGNFFGSSYRNCYETEISANFSTSQFSLAPLLNPTSLTAWTTAGLALMGSGYTASQKFSQLQTVEESSRAGIFVRGDGSLTVIGSSHCRDFVVSDKNAGQTLTSTHHTEEKLSTIFSTSETYDRSPLALEWISAIGGLICTGIDLKKIIDQFLVVAPIGTSYPKRKLSAEKSEKKGKVKVTTREERAKNLLKVKIYKHTNSKVLTSLNTPEFDATVDRLLLIEHDVKNLVMTTEQDKMAEAVVTKLTDHLSTFTSCETVTQRGTENCLVAALKEIIHEIRQDPEEFARNLTKQILPFSETADKLTDGKSVGTKELLKTVANDGAAEILPAATKIVVKSTIKTIKPIVQTITRKFIEKFTSFYSQPKIIVSSGKLDYLFGRVTSSTHNTARSQQCATFLRKLGIGDTPKGRNLVQQHLETVAKQDISSVARTFTNKHGNFEVRESLLAGPSGKFAKLESTWKQTSDGYKLITVIPKH